MKKLMTLSSFQISSVHLFFIILGLEWASGSQRHHGNNNNKVSITATINSTTAEPPIFDHSDQQQQQQQHYDHHYQSSSSSDVGVTHVTTGLGQAAFLHCRVRHLGDRRVLWMRQRDLHILTSALHTYTNDWRISALHSSSNRPKSLATTSDTLSKDEDHSSWSEWTLRIRATEPKDAGLYECQVSTEPKISKLFRLHVVVSKAMILGSAELFVKKGSDINLTCVTTVADEAAAMAANKEQHQQQQPLHFTWHHNGQMLNYSARPGGGLSVTTDTIAGQSRLLLARADPSRDSGNYTCIPGPASAGGATPASVTVTVLNGEQPAAMQRDNSASKTVLNWSSFLLVTLSTCMTHYRLSRIT